MDNYAHEIIIEICNDQPIQSQTCTIYHPYNPPIVRPPVGNLGKLVGEYKKRFQRFGTKRLGDLTIMDREHRTVYEASVGRFITVGRGL